MESLCVMKAWKIVLVSLACTTSIVVLFYLAGASQMARLSGTITKVRTLGVEPKAAVAIVDFRATNNSEVLFMSGERRVTVIGRHGIKYDGRISSAFDLSQLFKYFPALGAMTHEPYIKGIKLKPGQSIVGMLAARFEMSKTDLDMRREIILDLYDSDGSLTELKMATQPQ